jgi:hypothetical protein
MSPWCFYTYHQSVCFPPNAWMSMKQTRQVSGVGGWSNGRVYVVVLFTIGATAGARLTTLSTLKLRVFARAQRSEDCRPPRSACADTLQSTALSPRESGLLRRKESNRERMEWVFGSVPGQVHSRGWLNLSDTTLKKFTIHTWVI